MPGPLLQPDTPDPPGDIPAGLDPLSVGQSIFGECQVPEPPVVEGYAQITFRARGGFGQVWRARRESDGISVALKIPHQTDPETAERLELEAAALQSLDHPHIVQLFAVTASADGSPVLVMELVEGPCLTERLPASGFDFDHALQIFLPVLDAVAHAHSRGIVHRDLKPSNILLAADGTPEVSDFGLAQSLKDRQVAFSLTRSGVLAGTVEYLAPERYEPGSESSPAAADIFALGIILYELLTGRPPRGAWPPLSQIKRLDVRLDELLSDAIHPDPAKRLPSATVFRQRLEEIRDSRPRYAGTPLVTKPVRYADFVWTVAGLYFLAAGFCSLLSMNNTKVPGLFDLTFHHRKMLGGYWALLVLVMGMSFVWSWQAMRLWSFRHVPMREALPSPFGLRIGHTRGAVVLVFFAQLLCAWGPLIYMAWIYSQCWFWAAPDTAPWEPVLAVTTDKGTGPVSPWTWDPAGMFTSDEYWIREMHPGISPGVWVFIERQSFFIFTQPLVMTLCAAAIGVGVLATITAGAREWVRRRQKLLALFLISTCSLGLSLHATVQDEQSSRMQIRHNGQGSGWMMEMRMGQEAQPHLLELFRLWSGPSNPDTNGKLKIAATNAFAATVEYGEGNFLPREEFIRQLLDSRPPENVPASFEAVEFFQTEPRPGQSGVFVECFLSERYASLPDHSSTGAWVVINIEFRLSDRPPVTVPALEILTAWLQKETPLYIAEERELTREAAVAWLRTFLHCLSTQGTPELESFLLPVMLGLAWESPERENLHSAPVPRDAAVAPLRAGAAKVDSFAFPDDSTLTLRHLPGARWELACDIRPSSTRNELLRWQLEIVFADGRWQILRLRM